MLEDPRFITRRILICAAEDVGLADPMALVLANAAHQAVNRRMARSANTDCRSLNLPGDRAKGS
jgi:replication-associated recombination protein RarA